jgi:NNP family nitrate/nitrite transporter-like MFS transporter
MKNKILNNSHYNEDETLKAQLMPVFFLTAIFFLNFTIRIIISPLLPSISAGLDLTRDQAGSLFMVSAAGYFIALLWSGFVSSRLWHKKTIAFSALTAGMAFLLTGLSQNLFQMRIGLFIVGMAAAFYVPSGLAVLTGTIRPQHWGKAISIHELAPNLSFLLSPLICEALLLCLSWRSVFIVIGGMSIVAGMSFFKFSTVKDFSGEAPVLTSFLPLVTTPSFWMMITLFSLGVAGTLGVYSMLPLYLVNVHGMIQAQANTLITLSRILTLPMALLVGWLADYFGLKRTLAAILFFTGIATLLIGILTDRNLYVLLFCQPVFSVCFFPPAFAALSHIGSKETRNIAVSFTIPIAFLAGGGLVPNIIGILGENGFFSLGFILTGGFILLGTMIPFFLKFQNNN